ncbi:PREDICTED: probable phenylalanine--tRNA ligase, mitochondrial [Ceratosolen solmsi marchali]|uniref:Phenylalanine--tRNA ligase, mitochondrial n=1 Tax=Ceratosolen solmsi marchali TaxID=326594 RepID=A0AAJ7DXQ7_9HYME|nr:PREDICTED: probable phenylalanine--tRNA ligase, mitochondrial [Ceratosolen solmsi marchali]
MKIYWFRLTKGIKNYNLKLFYRSLSNIPEINKSPRTIKLLNYKYSTDNWTNITPKIISHLGQNLHIAKNHPLSYVRQRIINHFYKSYLNRLGNPLFSVYDNINPIVTTVQNFDSLLIPIDHVSRAKSDCYYINQETLLRAHTTAHQAELIALGLDNFLIIGDVYRRDEIDCTHYPVFHQVDGVRLCTMEQIFKNVRDPSKLNIFEYGSNESIDKQRYHTLEAVKIMEYDLKKTLVGLVQTLFGKDIKYRWVNQIFPFTHPSWELEICFNDKWLEILGCGIIRQEILHKTGAVDRIGWAFGLGLERLAMCLYSIPDIRLFWSTDSGFLNQFVTDNINSSITYKPISLHPQCTNDISFWLPQDIEYSSNDFYDIVREIGGDKVEQILLIDTYVNPKTKRTSHCYKIVYRHMERVLSQEEVNKIHKQIEITISKQLNVVIR